MNNVMENCEPPAKKQRIEGGLGHPTSSGLEVDPTLKKKNPNTKKKKTKEVKAICESVQFKENNYRGALQEHFQKQGGDIKLKFETLPKTVDGSKQPVFICTCTAGDLTATGEAKSKKQAVQLAALAAIKQIEQVPLSEDKPVKESKPEPEQSKTLSEHKKKEVKPIIENKQYLNGNFRGALQEHIQKKYPGVKLDFKTELQEPVTQPGVFIATCKAVGSEDEQIKEMVGTGHASNKKSAIHFSALEFMLKLKLLTAQEHFKIHHGKNCIADAATAVIVKGV